MRDKLKKQIKEVRNKYNIKEPNARVIKKQLKKAKEKGAVYYLDDELPEALDVISEKLSNNKPVHVVFLRETCYHCHRLIGASDNQENHLGNHCIKLKEEKDGVCVVGITEDFEPTVHAFASLVAKELEPLTKKGKTKDIVKTTRDAIFNQFLVGIYGNTRGTPTGYELVKHEEETDVCKIFEENDRIPEKKRKEIVKNIKKQNNGTCPVIHLPKVTTAVVGFNPDAYKKLIWGEEKEKKQ